MSGCSAFPIIGCLFWRNPLRHTGVLDHITVPRTRYCVSPRVLLVVPDVFAKAHCKARSPCPNTSCCPFLCAQGLLTLITFTICVVAQGPRATSRPVQDARRTPHGPRAWPSNPTWIRWRVGGPFSKRFRCFPWTTRRRFPADGRATRVCDYPLFELGFASKLYQVTRFVSSDAFEVPRLPNHGLGHLVLLKIF